MELQLRQGKAGWRATPNLHIRAADSRPLPRNEMQAGFPRLAYAESSVQEGSNSPDCQKTMPGPAGPEPPTRIARDGDQQDQEGGLTLVGP